MRLGGVDLHLHTSVSDGSQSPAATVREAEARGVTLIAITDHDTTEGVAEAMAAAEGTGVMVVPGVEIGADSDQHDVHILGYYLRWEEPELQEALRVLREGRDLRNERILEKLGGLGAEVDPDRVREISGPGSVGRPHIAAAMVEAGHVGSQGEAFGRYLGRGKAAFVPRARLSPEEACRIIKQAGGIPVLAHGAKVGSREVVRAALDAGIEGIEAFHSDHTGAEVESLLALAKARNLLVTGGTDSHGPHSGRPTAVGSVTLPAWVGEGFLARAPEWWRARYRLD
jgi:3',5'-nucleoside bisphosphate phosphatase